VILATLRAFQTFDCQDQPISVQALAEIFHEPGEAAIKDFAPFYFQMPLLIPEPPFALYSSPAS